MKTFFLLFIQYTRHLRVVDELFNEKNIQINWLSQNKRRRAQHTDELSITIVSSVFMVV